MSQGNPETLTDSLPQRSLLRIHQQGALEELVQVLQAAWLFQLCEIATWGVSENRGPQYSTLNSRILMKKNPKVRYLSFSEIPTCATVNEGPSYGPYIEFDAPPHISFSHEATERRKVYISIGALNQTFDPSIPTRLLRKDRRKPNRKPEAQQPHNPKPFTPYPRMPNSSLLRLVCLWDFAIEGCDRVLCRAFGPSDLRFQTCSKTSAETLKKAELHLEVHG